MFESNNEIRQLQNELKVHPIYNSINSLDALRCFVEHHIYSVWDFMSIVKYLQSVLAPSSYPWVPTENAELRRFINEIVLEEESDETQNKNVFLSHFEIYQNAMKEIGADVITSGKFIKNVNIYGLNKALEVSTIPNAAKKFINSTFKFIINRKLHVIASVFAFGRETIVPSMFKSIIKKIGIDNNKCPTFIYYINRHIDVDDVKHGPLSISLVQNICNNDKRKYEEALEAAKLSLHSRIIFWNEILDSIQLRNITSNKNKFFTHEH